MVISDLDNKVFTLFVKNGVLGLEPKKKADEITTRSFNDITSTGSGRKCRMLGNIYLYYVVAVISWIMILVWRVSGTIARRKGCDVDNYSYLGDGTCNAGAYNTEACEWDAGDCKEVPGYFGCHVGKPSEIGNGKCDGGDYNTKLCGWDGGDCVVPEYPDCHVDFPSWIGDEVCNNYGSFDYNTTECGWDGGDCLN